MMTAAVRRRVALLRQPREAARLALVLWTVWAIVVWNVVFDHVIVVAGRVYLHDAALAARGLRPHAHMDDYMRPAVTSALWIASAAAAIVLAVGIVAIRAASREPRPLTP